MRQVVLDTETTGLEPEAGHRIIEIGCVEIVNRRTTNNRFHRYLNPGRLVDRGAVEVTESRTSSSRSSRGSPRSRTSFSSS
jgi:DNA polymerase-3 subunit epsilon